MPEQLRTWTMKAMNALAEGDKKVREESVTHLAEKFGLRSSIYYKFDDDSCLQITQAFGTRVYFITREKLESRKLEHEACEAKIRKFEEWLGIEAEGGQDA